MKKLYERKAVLHSLVWLILYLVLNTISDNIAGALNLDFNMVTAIPNLLLSVICYFYLKRTSIANDIGLLTKPAEKSSVMLYYIPLIILPFLNLIYGINTSLSIVEIAFLLAMYAGVGFMEEVIFRGLMFKALIKKWNRYVVVIFISFTFAMGHIVSMTAIGQNSTDTVLQIINALVVGCMFMTVILASGNLTICIIVHIMYNFIGNISMANSSHIEIIAVNTTITVLYFLYLFFKGKHTKAFFSNTNSF
ncbi:CPBP family intramembrane glutamic endopeptidase [Clostridium sp. 'White wine YQ']|uniref:CPBP family intramembrane glutamic endopeptidase n=1 Tax=Clostridium sp. 'White wine YQ' TaxID=3027474 RepID=UPI002367173F|nr:CPBP family intramembrane glutamic endopeptidase [Clostridium sp. 'White wine YQ']MDD7794429.1 CPBP family intramembrane metalloprotease [Clostridium sp. 'White wine YQ']